MGERDGDVGSSSLPSATTRKPTIIRPASKLIPECPPRPQSTPHPISGTTGSAKVAGHPASNKPVNELEFKDITSSTANSGSDDPTLSAGTLTHNASAREQTERGTSKKIGLPSEEAGDDDGDDDKKVVRKPSLQLRPLKPTIIRPQSRLQSTTDVTPITEITPEHSSAQSIQSNSSAESSSVPTVSPSVPAHPLPSPKPRLRESVAISSDPQMPIHSASEKKPLQMPPARPPSIFGSDYSSQKSTSGQSVIHGQTGQPLATQASLATANKTPSPNPHSTVKSAAETQPPKRPSGPPRPNLPGRNKSKDQIEVNAKPSVEAERQFSQTVPVSLDDLKEASPSSVSQIESASHSKENSDNKAALPKPKPRPKPRPISMTSPGVKEETQATPVDSLDSSVNKQPSPSNLPLQSTPHDTQLNVLKPKPSPATTTADPTNQEHHNAVPEKPKPLSISVKARTEMSGAKEDDLKPFATASSDNKKSGPAVHRPPSAASDIQPKPLSQLPSITSGEPNIMPSPPRRAKRQATAAQQNPVHQVNPPPRPASSAPVKSKPTFVSEKPPHSSDSSSSSIDVDRAELTKPSQPAASRMKQQTGPPLPKRPGPGHPLYSYMSREPHGIALHEYTASHPDELSFNEGDTVVLVKEIDANWIVGQVGDKVGMFPATYVEVKCPLGGEKSRNSIDKSDSGAAFGNSKNNEEILTGPRCRARFDFEGDGESELALEDGEVVQIIEKVGDEWLKGKKRGRHGIFPSSFVEIIEDLPPGGSTGENMSNTVSALFDFDGKDGELTFKAGDKISQIQQVNSEWLFGHSNGQKGQFPASFVSNIPPNLPKYDLEPPAQSKKQQKQKAELNGRTKEHSDSKVPGDEFWESREAGLGFCIGMFDYTDPSPGDLEFKVGDRIEILEFIGEDWARGRLENREGLIPLRFVAEELNSPPRTPEPEIIKKVFGTVLHDFDGETADDLAIKEGDIIEVGDFADVNKNWRWGTLNGKKGMFPAVFVDILE